MDAAQGMKQLPKGLPQPTVLRSLAAARVLISFRIALSRKDTSSGLVPGKSRRVSLAATIEHA